MVGTGTNAIADLQAALDDRNRTAPFPFCGNRFEFRAVGSSQNIAMPLSFLDTAVSAGMAHLSDLIEGGMSPRDAVAQVLNEHKAIIFNGDGYSDEWPIEAAKRGLPNNKNMVTAWKAFNTQKTKDLFTRFGVLSADEVDAKVALAFGDFATTQLIEGQVASRMAQTMFLPALAKDLQNYNGPAAGLSGNRAELYAEVASRTAALDAAVNGFPHDADEEAQADYALDNIKTANLALREVVDQAELLCEDSLWPVPSYEDMLLSVQNDAAPARYEGPF
jgi:glutamine synthetase